MTEVKDMMLLLLFSHTNHVMRGNGQKTPILILKFKKGFVVKCQSLNFCFEKYMISFES